MMLDPPYGDVKLYVLAMRCKVDAISGHENDPIPPTEKPGVQTFVEYRHDDDEAKLYRQLARSWWMHVLWGYQRPQVPTEVWWGVVDPYYETWAGIVLTAPRDGRLPIAVLKREERTREFLRYASDHTGGMDLAAVNARRNRTAIDYRKLPT